MSGRKLIASASLILIALVATPSKASADWLVTPYVGWNWGGSANFINFSDFDDQFEQRANFGVSFGYMGAGVIGFELTSGTRRTSSRTPPGRAISRSAIATSRR